MSKLRSPLHVGSKEIALHSDVRYLGVKFQTGKAWNRHREVVAAKLKAAVPHALAVAKGIDSNNLNFALQVFDALVMSQATYAIAVWGQDNLDRLDGIAALPLLVFEFKAHSTAMKCDSVEIHSKVVVALLVAQPCVLIYFVQYDDGKNKNKHLFIT